MLDDVDQLDALAELVRGGGVVVLSGAGLSTESGIPDYRGGGSDRPRPAPMTYQAFVGDPAARRRYWARSHLGWRRMSMAAPNDGHRSVVTLERRGLVDAVITQNVDGLHTAAGSSRVIDLHGRLARVVCLGCGGLTSRRQLDERLREANAEWGGRSTALRPDGDVEVTDADVADFSVVDCLSCGGVLKPDVVYFGENVPRERVEAAYALTDTARALLVLGSSLTVFSGRRFVVRAFEAGIPVGIVNRGATRGDDAATVRIDAPLGEVMRMLVARLEDAT